MARQKLTDRTIAALKPATQEQRQYEVWDRILPAFGVRVGYGGAKTFVVMTRIDGKVRRFTVGRYGVVSLAEARDAARKIITDAAKGIDPKERQRAEKRERERQRRNTFGAVAAEFMRHHAADLRTAGEMQRKLDVDILPVWGDRPIRDITRADVRQLLRDKAATAPIAANRLLALISTIFNWAIDEEIIEANPAARMKKPAMEAERERSLTDDEIRAIWNATEVAGYPFGSLFRVLLLTGQRRNEVAAMRWSEIRGDEWHIPSERAKSGKGHSVPLAPLTLEVLESVPRTGDLLFTSGRRGEKPLQGWSRAKERLDDILRENGTPVEDWHIHDLRRTVATGMRTLGVDRLIVSKVLNHAEAGITRVYDRYSADPEKRHALERWAAHVEGLVRPASTPNNVVALRG